MPAQNLYPVLTTVDGTTYVTGFYTDTNGDLQTVKIPSSYVYGNKWTVGSGAPVGNGVGAGDMYLDELTGNTYQWNGSTWTLVATLITGLYDIPIQCLGKPLSGETLYLFVAPRGFTLPMNLPNSQGKAGTAATGVATFNIQKNGTTVGTCTFTGGTTAAFSLATSVSFAAGDELSVVAPSPADASLANIAITLAGTRP